MIEMMNGKRGNSGITIILWIVLGIFILFVASYVFNGSFSPLGVFKSGSASTSPPTYMTPYNIVKDKAFSGIEANSAGGRFLGLIGGAFTFIVGDVPVIRGQEMGYLIAIICIWGMMALAFGDIFRNLSFFSEGVSWAIAILFAIAAANLGMIGTYTVFITQFFAGLGMLSVYIGLGASFFVFIMIEFGISSFGPWLMERKAMQHAEKYKAKELAGGTELSGTITALKSVGNALKDFGKSTP